VYVGRLGILYLKKALVDEIVLANNNNIFAELIVSYSILSQEGARR